MQRNKTEEMMITVVAFMPQIPQNFSHNGNMWIMKVARPDTGSQERNHRK